MTILVRPPSFEEGFEPFQLVIYDPRLGLLGRAMLHLRTQFYVINVTAKWHLFFGQIRGGGPTQLKSRGVESSNRKIT